MTREKLTPAIEDYLRIIYDLSSQDCRVKTTQIAKALEVTPASVTGMIQKLASNDPPLVDYRKHHGAKLTPEGMRVALQLIRSHRLLETFLHETMGFPWDEVHQEAHQLEHVISPAFEERMAEVLQDPSYDPHGAPIPTPDLEMPNHSHQSLRELRTGQRAVIQRVPDEDPELLRYLESEGVTPNARIKITRFTPFDDNLEITISGRDTPLVLGPGITGLIFVVLEDLPA
ncbi:MAG: metal-dependent transcriptional regulator [Anaerolineales bacterium]|jgi:DtxR family Mn-dependent transcriptional regulator